MVRMWYYSATIFVSLLAMCFVTLLSVFGTLGVLFRLVSSRELRSIDALANETEEFRITDV